MHLNDFLNFNNSCPICNKELTLYMQIRDSFCLKGTRVNENYHFTQCFTDDSNNNKIILENRNNSHRIITSRSIKKILNDNMFFFFYLCNEKGMIAEYADYYIDIYYGCYYRSSFDLKLNNNKTKFCNKNIININSNEGFSITSIDNNKDIEKVFLLNFDYTNNVTDFYFYSSSEEERNEENFKPKLLIQSMPILLNRPYFDNESKIRLIQKMESWVMMS